MTAKECYELIGGNYEEALRRVMMDSMIEKLSAMFLDDKSYVGLVAAMEENDYDEAFKMAHTLKGVCQNLAYTALGSVSDELTEALRENKRDVELAKQLFEKTKVEYERTVNGLKEFLG